MGDILAFWFSAYSASPLVERPAALPPERAAGGSGPIPLWLRLVLAFALLAGIVCAAAGVVAGVMALVAGDWYGFPVVMVVVGVAVARAARKTARQMRKWEQRHRGLAEPGAAADGPRL
jgi:type IV secretory pathway TrbD component